MIADARAGFVDDEDVSSSVAAMESGPTRLVWASRPLRGSILAKPAE